MDSVFLKWIGNAEIISRIEVPYYVSILQIWRYLMDKIVSLKMKMKDNKTFGDLNSFH